jgi:carbon-monoxide dehydrogenase large subunit
VINPLIVEGQVQGAIAQGIGGALLEHHVYDASGQLLTGTFMEYAMPTAAVIPPLEVTHIEEPAANLVGVRGVGEGADAGPAAVLANAVADALSPLRSRARRAAAQSLARRGRRAERKKSQGAGGR